MWKLHGDKKEEILHIWKRDNFSSQVLSSSSIFPPRPVYPSATWAEQDSQKDKRKGEENVPETTCTICSAPIYKHMLKKRDLNREVEFILCDKKGSDKKWLKILWWGKKEGLRRIWWVKRVWWGSKEGNGDGCNHSASASARPVHCSLLAGGGRLSLCSVYQDWMSTVSTK